MTYLEDGANIKFTTGKWLTPNGNWINEKGIKPDIQVDYPDYASLAYIDPNKEYKVGSDTEVIESAEKMLEVLGYTPGEVNNVFTEETASALKQFQQENELEATGVLAGETTYALMDALRVKMTEDDPQMLKAKELLMGTKATTTEN